MEKEWISDYIVDNTIVDKPLPIMDFLVDYIVDYKSGLVIINI